MQVTVMVLKTLSEPLLPFNLIELEDL